MSKRRANGEGKIRKRPDGRWEGRYVAGHDENGKAIRKNVLGKTQAEVKEKLKKAIGECAEVDVERAKEYTVGAWVRTWYETYSKPHIRESTQEFYEDYIEHHVVPRIGGIKLTKLTGRDMQKLYNDVKANGRIRVSKDGNTGMSASYVRGLHMMLHNCLGRAVKERLILRNPTEDCIVPKQEKKEMHILHPEDISAYLKEADRRGVLAMFFLELTTGLRKGELVALLWSDLDETSMTLNVCKQAVRVKGGGVKVTRPKTETSILRRRFHPPYLHPRHHKNAGGSRSDNGQADWGECMSKIYTAITKKGRGMPNPTALCYPILSAPNLNCSPSQVQNKLTHQKEG